MVETVFCIYWRYFFTHFIWWKDAQCTHCCTEKLAVDTSGGVVYTVHPWTVGTHPSQTASGREKGGTRNRAHKRSQRTHLCWNGRGIKVCDDLQTTATVGSTTAGLSLSHSLSVVHWQGSPGGRRGDWLSPEKGEAEVRNLRACVCLCQPVKSWCVCTLDGQGRNVAPGKVVFWRDQHNYDWITGNFVGPGSPFQSLPCSSTRCLVQKTLKSKYKIGWNEKKWGFVFVSIKQTVWWNLSFNFFLSCSLDSPSI